MYVDFAQSGASYRAGCILSYPTNRIHAVICELTAKGICVLFEINLVAVMEKIRLV